ncbi:hypothetical protein ACHAWF_006719 [Thalassiosira exigua]
MTFAEQLAARAAKTHSSSQHQRKIPTSDSPVSPRPGKMIPRGGNGPSPPPSSSPSLFADQLKTRASCAARSEGNGPRTSQRPSGLRPARRTLAATPSPGNSFAAQASERSFETTLPPQIERTKGGLSHLTESPVTLTPSECSWEDTSAATPVDAGRHSKLPPGGVGRSQRNVLLPPCNAPDSSFEDEEDEYASVGFSLQDASDVSTVGEGGRSEAGSIVDSKSRATRVTQEGRRYAGMPAPSSSRGDPRKGSRTHTHGTPVELPREKKSFQHNLSPIEKDAVTASHTWPHPLEEANGTELQSRLRKQLLKCQTPKSHRTSHSNDQLPQATTTLKNTGPHTRQRSGSDIHSSRAEHHISPTNEIFGAWAQIESLKRRVHEAEEHARQESQRADSARHELSLVREHQSSENVCNSNAGDDVALPSDAGNFPPEECVRETVADGVVTVRDCQAGPSSLPGTSRNGNIREKETGDAMESLHSNAPHDNALELHSWKKRALEAEERLAKEAERMGQAAAATATPGDQPPTPANAAASTSAPTPPSRHLEESDLIRLKNAEIDVLRHQIHRLERRIEEECDRNEDLIRSTYFQHVTPGSGSPLVVASECMADSAQGSNTNMDELRLLRNEIRHLQYQLRYKTNGRSTNSTTGESTLSSLDGNENNYEECQDEQEGEVEDDCNNASSWGLCCIRRSRRGYGRVMKS